MAAGPPSFAYSIKTTLNDVTVSGSQPIDKGLPT